jgi:hypothetical protein
MRRKDLVRRMDERKKLIAEEAETLSALRRERNTFQTTP